MRAKIFSKKVLLISINIIASLVLFLSTVIHGEEFIQSESFSEQVLNSPQRSVHRMIVFVHGTILPIPSLHGVKKVAQHIAANGLESAESLYQQYLDGRRDKKGLYGYQPLGEKGLTEIDEVYSEQSGYTYASKLLRDIFMTNTACKKSSQESCSCYVFGWDGRLEHANRVAWAKQLHQALSEEIKKVRQTCVVHEIVIDIFAHSHGGNVALLLADAQQQSTEKLSVDRLVMLGTPIQEETEKYVLDPMFKKAYLIYSRGDSVQVLDVISTKGKSKRFFTGELERKKVVQIEATIDGKNPTHGELWSYGMVGQLIYRKKMSIYPLPVVAFAPSLLQEFDDLLFLGNSLKIDISRKWDNFGWPKVQPKDSFFITCTNAIPCKREFKIQSKMMPESNKILFRALNSPPQPFQKKI